MKHCGISLKVRQQGQDSGQNGQLKVTIQSKCILCIEFAGRCNTRRGREHSAREQPCGKLGPCLPCCLYLRLRS